MRITSRKALNIAVISSIVIVVLLVLLAGYTAYILALNEAPGTPYLQSSSFLLSIVLAFALLLVWWGLHFCRRAFVRSGIRHVAQTHQTHEMLDRAVDYLPSIKPILDIVKQKDFQLEEEAQKLNWIISNIPGGLLVINKEEIFTFFNVPTFMPMGIDGRELEGKHISAWHEKIKLDSQESPLLRALYEGVNTRKQLTLGERHFEGINKPIIREDGSIEGALCLFLEITDRVERERELKRLDQLNLVGQMAASLGHEIRNPLTVIRGFMQTLSAREESRANAEHYNLVIAEVDRVNEILNEFLSLAKNRKVVTQHESLHRIVTEVEPLLRSEASLSCVELKLELRETAPMSLCKGEIKQLLFSLVRNAIQACEPGGTVTVKTGVNGTGTPFLTVIDTGCGMPPHVLQEVGTPFFTTKENGIGLGLPVCYGIAQRHGAILNINSAPGKGTRVCFCFASRESRPTNCSDGVLLCP